MAYQLSELNFRTVSDPKGFMEWLALHNRGRKEDFRRPGQ